MGSFACWIICPFSPRAAQSLIRRVCAQGACAHLRIIGQASHAHLSITGQVSTDGRGLWISDDYDDHDLCPYTIKDTVGSSGKSDLKVVSPKTRYDCLPAVENVWFDLVWVWLLLYAYRHRSAAYKGRLVIILTPANQLMIMGLKIWSLSNPGFERGTFRSLA
jgi:hypothetical protein